MGWFGKLKLNSKFNLILSSLLICLFLLTSLLAYRNQQALVLRMALEQGRGVANQIIETTDYISSVVRGEPAHNYALVPQVVATQIAKRMSAGSPYAVRQVSLTFRNPGNRPDDYETAQLKAFAATGGGEIYRVIRSGGEDVFRYMRAMVAEPSCLECHGSYERAPSFIQHRYPQSHPSYNYQVGEIIGAVSVSRPLADLDRELGANLRQELLYRGGILLLVFVAMGLLTRRFMIDPIRLASTTIHRVTTTGNLAERIPAIGSKDEVGLLLHDFNEMMEELDRTTLQRGESEDRYRNLIEATQAAIVTFLADGKIVISNHRAESLFGLAKDKLLGETLFDYLEHGADLRQRIVALAGARHWDKTEETARHRLRDSHGRWNEVEVTFLLASRADHNPMFTAILKEITAGSPEDTPA